jgi:hypothetical protein
MKGIKIKVICLVIYSDTFQINSPTVMVMA